MTEIQPYQPAFREKCIEVFESNQPKFFAEHEKDLFINWLDMHTSTNYYVLIHNGEVIGCGGIFVDDRYNTAGLSWGMVHSKFHKQGFGKLFTQYRLELIRSLYPDHICRIDTSQHTVSFYEQFGFKVTEVVPDGYGKDLHKHVMRMDPPGTKALKD